MWIDKNKLYRIIKKTGNFQPLLSKICPTFFGQYKENKPLRKNYLREKFYDVMEALGMSHRPHDTRRTFATILSKLGASESVITDLMGHTSFKTTEKHYIQNDIETLKEAIGQIEKIN